MMGANQDSTICKWNVPGFQKIMMGANRNSKFANGMNPELTGVMRRRKPEYCLRQESEENQVGRRQQIGAVPEIPLLDLQQVEEFLLLDRAALVRK